MLSIKPRLDWDDRTLLIWEAHLLACLNDSQVIEPLLELAREGNDWAMEALALRGAEGQKALIPLLYVGDVELSISILHALKGASKLFPEFLITPVIDLALGGYKYLNMIVDVLVKCGPDVTKPLTELVTHSSLEIQQFVTVVLERVGDEQCIECLSGALTHTDDEVRRSAIRGLSRLKHKPLIPLLVSLLKDKKWCWIAARGLKEIGDSAVEDDLLEALPVSEFIGTISILDALRSLGSTRAIPAVLPYLNHDGWDIQCAAANTLAYLRHPDALRFLLERLEMGDVDFGEYEQTGLLYLGTEAVLALIDFLKANPHHPNVAMYLGKIGDKRAVPVLESLLFFDASTVDLKEELTFGLEQGLGEDSIRQMTQDMVRRFAVIALGDIGDSSAIPALITSLEETFDVWEYSYILGALEAVGDPIAAVPIVAKLMTRPDEVNEAMLSALVAFRMQTGPLLLTLLDHTNEAVRYAAVLALGQARVGEATDKLRELEENEAESDRVRYCARLAHVSITSALQREQAVG